MRRYVLAPNFCTPRSDMHSALPPRPRRRPWAGATLEPADDLDGQALLDLQVAGEQLHDATELAKADDPVVGEIPDVCDAVEGQEMVHAQRVKWDRPCDDQFVVAVVIGEGGRPKRLRCQQLRESVGLPTRRLLKRFGVRSAPSARRSSRAARCTPAWSNSR